MALQQTSRSLLQACVRHRFGILASSIEAAYQQQCLLNATSSTSASLPVSQQAATSLWQLSFNGVRTFSDAPSPSDPMIIPLRNQPAPQQPHPAGPPDRNQGPWEKVQDKHTGGTYWWNTQTGEVLCFPVCKSSSVGLHKSAYVAAALLSASIPAY